MTATSYAFATDRTDLALEPGWTQHYGDAGALLPGSGVIHRGTVTNAEHFYREGALVSGSQKAGFTFGAAVGSTAPRLVVLGSGTAGALTSYELEPLTATSLRVVRRIAGAGTNILTPITVASSSAAFSLEVIINGANNNTINVYDATGTQIGTVPDTTAGIPSSGYNGLVSFTNSSSAVSNGDNFLGNMQDAAAAGVAAPMLLMGAGS